MQTIVVADDDRSVRLLIRTTLESPDCRILEAADGAAALSLCREAPPDALILDRMMPGATGVEVVRALRQDPVTAGIPVIIVTIVDEEAPWEGTDLEVAAYLVKPFSPLELRKTLARVLLDRPATPPVRPAFDAASLMERVEGDSGLACELAEMFLVECHKRLSELERAVAEEDVAQIEQVAHLLKGSAGVLAAGATMEAARRMETMARAGDLSQAPQAFQELRQTVASLERALNLFLAEKAS